MHTSLVLTEKEILSVLHFYSHINRKKSTFFSDRLISQKVANAPQPWDQPLPVAHSAPAGGQQRAQLLLSSPLLPVILLSSQLAYERESQGRPLVNMFELITSCEQKRETQCLNCWVRLRWAVFCHSGFHRCLWGLTAFMSQSNFFFSRKQTEMFPSHQQLNQQLLRGKQHLNAIDCRCGYQEGLLESHFVCRCWNLWCAFIPTWMQFSLKACHY